MHQWIFVRNRFLNWAENSTKEPTLKPLGLKIKSARALGIFLNYFIYSGQTAAEKARLKVIMGS